MDLPEFRNEPYTDFSIPSNRQAMQAALQKVRTEFGREYRLRLDAEEITTHDLLKSVNPSNPREIVGVHHKGTPEMANRAVKTAFSYFHEWSRTAAEQRVGFLL